MLRQGTLVAFIFLISPAVTEMPLYANIPLDTFSEDGKFRFQQNYAEVFKKIKNEGIYGIVVDVWWGITEREPQVYDFSAYRELTNLVKASSLKVKFILSFHECGSTANDDHLIRLPSWVDKTRQTAIFYTDHDGSSTDSYISLFADDEKIFGNPEKGYRTPLEIYSDFMRAFSEEFNKQLNDVIDEIVVGLGPSGQLRYPGYRLHSGFCGNGAFQCFDENAKKSLRAAALAYDADVLVNFYKKNQPKRLKGHEDFTSKEGIKEVLDYNKKPDQSHFFYPREKTCNLHPFQRDRCEAKNEQECNSTKCCWDSKGPESCYKQAVNYCLLAKVRQDCGVLGTTEEECNQKGCCWDSSKYDKPFCFKPGTMESYQTRYGEFFLNWYESKLYEHGERIIYDARLIFPDVPISIKLPSVHWMVSHSSRAAEATAGYNHTSGSDPYRKLMLILKRYKVGLIFSGFATWNTPNNECYAKPELLVDHIKSLSKELEVDLIGEQSSITTPGQINDYDRVISQLDGLAGYIPFRITRDNNTCPACKSKLIDRVRGLTPQRHYKLRGLERVLAVIEKLDCFNCMDCPNTNSL